MLKYKVQNEYTGLVIIYITCPTISVFRDFLTYVKRTVNIIVAELDISI